MAMPLPRCATASSSVSCHRENATSCGYLSPEPGPPMLQKGVSSNTPSAFRRYSSKLLCPIAATAMTFPDDEKATPSNFCKLLGGVRIWIGSPLASISKRELPVLPILSSIEFLSHANQVALNRSATLTCLQSNSLEIRPAQNRHRIATARR